MSTPQPERREAGSGVSFGVKGAELLRRFGTVLVFVGMCLVLTVIQPRFLTYGNLTNVARQVSIVAIMATGMTMVIISGGVDLSVSTVAALAGCVAAKLMRGHSIAYSVLVALSIGACAGAVNGEHFQTVCNRTIRCPKMIRLIPLV